MPELERYMLSLPAELDAKLRQAVEDFDFNTYVRALTDFANEDLSAFYFDIRKDCLYCERRAAQTRKRRAYRTVLDTLFHALVRWLAPVLVFTSRGSVGDALSGRRVGAFARVAPAVPASGRRMPRAGELGTAARTSRPRSPRRSSRSGATRSIGSSLEAEVAVARAPQLRPDLAELFIVSSVATGDAWR